MKKNKYLQLFKDIIVFSLGSFGSKLILFLMVPLYTNYLTAEEYGTTELIFTFMQLVVPFASLVIYDAVLRFGLSKENIKEDVLKNGLFVISIGTLVTIVLVPIIGFYDELSVWKLHLGLFVVLSMYLSLFQNYLKVKERNIQFAIVSIIQTISLATLNILFLAYRNLGVLGYITSNLLSYLISILACIFLGDLYKDIKKGRINYKLLKEMIVFSAPLIFNNISWWIIQSSDKLMISNMISVGALGIYTVSTKIPSLINVCTNIFQQAWSISTIKEIESSNDKQFYATVFEMLQTTVFLFSILISLFIKPFMSVYVGSSYFGAWIYVPMLIVAAAFGTISAFFGNLYNALKMSFNSMVSTIFSALINIVLNLILIPKIEIWGAVIGTMVSYFLIMFIRLFDCQKYLNIPIDLKKFIVNSFVVVMLSVIISIGVTPYLPSIAALLIFSLINRKVYMNMFYKLKNRKKV